jgi:hypothetical protein
MFKLTEAQQKAKMMEAIEVLGEARVHQIMKDNPATLKMFNMRNSQGMRSSQSIGDVFEDLEAKYPQLRGSK